MKLQQLLSYVRKAIDQYDMIQEGLNAKLIRTPEDVRTKFRSSLSRIVNEGANGLVCLIL